ncbi:hypothetical protein TWF730_000541 [Orbilia blumenaviensis]|uniref:DUS-like FMN-binding domain-containing protein n=1 Tax=Orbilia blumenaviensis TaxID=1796055 RepID=A0AAV9VN51_9PEZI
MNRLLKLPSVRQALRLHCYAYSTMTDHAIAPPVPPPEPGTGINAGTGTAPADSISAVAPTTTSPVPAKKYGKVVLAPMVRSGQLATRLLSLKYGADIVWGPETIDKSLIGCERVENPVTGCVDYMRTGLIFRACPSREKSKFIFQMGTAAPDTAVAAAKIVAQDVSGIDVNSGCPKPFSTHAGMGAALLKDIPRLLSILNALVAEVGLSTPYALPISVKIRLLPTVEETHALVTSLCKTGISKLTLHCRTPPMRPRERAIRDALAGAAAICKEAGVEFFVNGDIKGWDDAQEVIKEYNIDGGAMIAIAAESNPSCFIPNHLGGPKPWREVVTEYVRIAMSVENPISNTKFCLLNMVPGKNEMHKILSRAKTYRDICKALEIECTFPEELDLGTLKTQRVRAQEEKEAVLQAERDERQKKLAEFKRKKAGEKEESNKRIKMDEDSGERSNVNNNPVGAAVAELAATDILVPAEAVRAVV